ncbi:hypothetical protein Sjap_008989 [Stephania japonica]|uniref:Uncharacterized protein n=1 Tax=Stephania japonica TaxID=461633 RepID=A0AAP0JRG0_9MAGN
MSQFSLSTTTTTTTTTTTITSTITTTTTTTHLSTLLLSDFILFCSFIVSNPLYFSYLLFFSPYLLKLFSFLSPLFITTFLLLLAFLTVSPRLVDNHFVPQGLPCKMGFLLSTYHTVLSKLRSKLDVDVNAEFRLLEELEAFMLVSQMSSFEGGEGTFEAIGTNCHVNCLPTAVCDVKSVEFTDYEPMFARNVAVKDPGEMTEMKNHDEEANWLQDCKHSNYEDLVDATAELFYDVKEEESFEAKESKSEVNCLNIGDVQDEKCNKEAETVQCKSLEGKQESLQGHIVLEGSAKPSKKYVEHRGEPLIVVRGAIRAQVSQDFDSPEAMSIVSENAKILGSNLESCGSMRKVKEWKRTLACKLYEERHNNAEGGEGMDLLWETYDQSEAGKVKGASNKDKKMKKRETKQCYDDVENNEDEDDDELDHQQFCCLQALKFSTGKMNLGMGKPNLMKISKALKGIGWFHQVSKHAKKGYNQI